MTKKLYSTLIFAFLIVFIGSSLSWAYTPGSVEVTVKDYVSGTLLSGATVTMEPGGYSGTTNASGIVTFTGITPYRNYQVKATLAGYTESMYGAGRTGLITVKTGLVTAVMIPFVKHASISGTVTSGVWPLEDAMVAIFRPAVMENEIGIEFDFINSAVTDAAGYYEFQDLPPGTYHMWAGAHLFYLEKTDLNLASEDAVSQNFNLTPGTTTLTYSPVIGGIYYNQTGSVGFYRAGTEYSDEFIAIASTPPGGEDAHLKTDVGTTNFMTYAPGEYIIKILVADLDGVCKIETLSAPMTNHPTEAIPSIIPGPSELPLLYNGTVYADSSGTRTVRAGEKVYLRGWGRDFNVPSPEEFNPAAPMFDIYGNKNGDWNQSAFSFDWSLRDGIGTDQTSLLSSTTDRNVSFTVPVGALAGDSFIATLTVTGDDSLAGAPADITVYVADNASSSSCAICHSENSDDYLTTAHAGVSVGCQDCHGPADQHNGNPAKIDTTHWPGNCGQCHIQFAEWQKSRHSDPLAFGHAEISSALMRHCYKCHYTDGFIGAVESAEGFHDFTYPMSVGSSVPKDTPNISCDVCHDPHKQSVSNPVGLRTGSADSLCGTCHEEKWQNATYTAHGSQIGNAYHWDDYSQYEGAGNVHQMPDGCVSCHMSNAITDTDALGVRKVGVHTMRMRDVGADGDPKTGDDILNITVCQGCHTGLSTFDRNGAQTTINNKLDTLGSMLKAENHDFLPPFQPGKCATCHRGGTMPFVDDTAIDVLEKAFLNYKLILHDRSLGIHNPGYIERLLDDSIDKVSAYITAVPPEILAVTTNQGSGGSDIPLDNGTVFSNDSQIIRWIARVPGAPCDPLQGWGCTLGVEKSYITYRQDGEFYWADETELVWFGGLAGYYGRWKWAIPVLLIPTDGPAEIKLIAQDEIGVRTEVVYQIDINTPDTDEDGIPDRNDNCPDVCNPLQLDADLDGLGDLCDPDPGCGGCAPSCEDPCL